MVKRLARGGIEDAKPKHVTKLFFLFPSSPLRHWLGEMARKDVLRA